MAYYGGLGITNDALFGRLGQTVSGVGDINGDGVDDFSVFITGTYGIDGGDSTSAGTYIIFGSADGTLPRDINTSDLDVADGFLVTRDLDADGYYGRGFSFGTEVTALGDFNGDGFDDVYIGAPAYSGIFFEGPNVGGDGNGFILYGRDTATAGDFEANVVLGDALGTEGVSIVGVQGNVTAVESGDFNGDGQDDLLITVNDRTSYQESRTDAFVVFGGDRDLSEDVDLTTLDGENGFSFSLGFSDLAGGGGFYGEGGPGFYNGGSGAINLGDVNGDGFDDIGAAYEVTQAFYSRNTELPPGLQGADRYIRFENGYYYYNVTEVQRDAFVLFGADNPAGGEALRALQTDGESVQWDELSGGGIYYNNYYYGYGSNVDVAGIGDINGDGFDDVAFSITNRVLSAEFNPNEPEDGQSARSLVGVVFGGPDGVDRDDDGPQDGLNDNVSLGAFDSATRELVNEPDILIVNSNGASEQFGAGLVGLGDIDGDGIDDFAITVPGADADTGSGRFGEVFVVLGKDEDGGDSFPTIFDLDNLSQPETDGSIYRILQDNRSGADFAGSVSAAGDVNGDGFNDILIGAASYGDQNSEVFSRPGKAFVVFGGADNLEAVDNADGSNDNTLNVENLDVNALTGEVPIRVSVASSGFTQRQAEGDSGATSYEFTVQRTGDLQASVTVDYEVAGTGFSPASADDFVGGAFPSGTVTFAPGSASAVVTVDVQGDTEIEPSEDFFFTISNPSSDNGADISLGVTDSLAGITADDFPARISVNGIGDTEDGQLEFVIFRSGDTNSTVSVDFEVASATFSSPATDDDIANVIVDGVNLGSGLGQTGTLTFAAGETSKTILVDPVDDLDIETTEFVAVNLSGITGSGPVELFTTSQIAAIRNNDFPPQIFAGSNLSVREDTAGTIELEIFRRGETDGVVDVTYDLNPVPFEGSFFAADSNDVDGFLPTFGGVVRFEDGESVKTVSVTVNADGIIEPREQFELRITDVESFNGFTYTVIDPTQVVTIRNDDGRPPVIPVGVEADVFGDPHIVTLDGLGYDFQAVGEYVLVESTIVDDPRDFDVQVRFEPLPGSDLVSVTTRMAVNVGDVIVEVDALGDNPVLIDGVALTAEQLSLGVADVNDDGVPDLFFDEGLGEITIVLNDLNEQLKVANLDGVLNVCVFLSDAPGGHANNVIGLMGNANGDAMDDLQLRDGSVTYTDPTFEELYVTYADSWRVTQAERDFTDPPGTGEFPANFPAAKITIDDLPESVLAAAIAAVDAAGIDDPIIRESAILDFALTGDDDFILGALGLAADPVEEIDVTDAPEMPLTIGVSPSETSIIEGDSDTTTLIYTFWRIGDDSQDVVVDYAIGGDVNAADLAPGTDLTGQVTIPAGAGSASLQVGVAGDLTSELDELVVVSITGNDAGALVASARGTTEVITDDFVPVAEDDQFAGVADTVLTGDLLDENPIAPDSDADGDALTVTGITDANGGARFANGGLIILPSGAHLVVNPDGTFEYEPFGFANSAADTDFDQLGAGETGTDTFSYVISDGNGGTDTADVTITVQGLDDAPEAALDQYSVSEDDTVSGNALTDATTGRADSDPDGDTFEITAINGVALSAIDEDTATDGTQITVGDGGQLTIFANGDFTFDTAGAYEFLGEDATVGQLVARLQIVTYTITDDTGLSDSTSLRFSVTGVNDAPDTEDDTASTQAGTSVNIDVLANDTDPEGDDLSVATATSDDGQVVIEADGTITFTPNADFVGDAVISVDVSDGAALSGSTTTVSVNAAANNAPVAEDDSFTVDEDAGGFVSILENDEDADGDDLEVTILTGPSNGTVEDNGEGFFYNPNPDFNGADSFVYQIGDGNGGTDTATVNITVAPVNDAPDLFDAASSTAEDTELTLSLAINGFDVDGDTLEYSFVSTDGAGNVSISPTGELSYTPDADFNGLETITYQVSDGNGGLATAALEVTVTPVNDDPVANDDIADTAFNTSTVIDVLENDTDVDGDVLSVLSVDGLGTDGTVVLNDGIVEFTPDDQFVGVTTFSYTVTDGMGGFDTADVTVTVGAPAARSISISDASVVEGDSGTVSMTFTLTRTQLEGDVDALTMVDSVSVTSGDGTAQSGSDYHAVSEVVTFASGETEKTVTVTVLGDSDVEEDEFMFLDLADVGMLTGLQLTDAQGQGTILNDDVEVVNTAPIAADDGGLGFGTDEDTAFTTASVLGNDSDADGDAVSVVALDSTGTAGLVIDNGDGTFDYDPNGAFDALNDGESATDTFSYTVSDGNGGLDTATVTIDIAGVTDAVALNPIQGTDAPFEQLMGTDAADEISTGGGPFDYLTGGGGADVFVIEHETGDGRQMANILDYEVGLDVIDLQGAGIAIDYSFGNATYLLLEGGEFDTVIVNGASDIDQITFAEDVFIA